MLLVVPPWAPIVIPLWIVGRVSVIGSGLILAMTLACLWLLTHDGADGFNRSIGLAAHSNGPQPRPEDASART
jgi:hypothetical protein